MRTPGYTIQDVKSAVENNKSIAGVLRQLCLRPIGGNYRTINRIIQEYSIDTSHFTGQGWNVGLLSVEEAPFSPQGGEKND